MSASYYKSCRTINHKKYIKLDLWPHVILLNSETRLKSNKTQKFENHTLKILSKCLVINISL